jgi:uncharacterized phage protein (TIGR02218 family)
MSKHIGDLQPAAKQRQFHELYKVTLRDGTVLRYCDTNLDIAHDVGDGAGVQIWRGGLGLDRSEVRTGIDLQIDDLTITVRNADLTMGGVTRSIAHWAKVRKFHGAQVDIYLYDYKRAASAPHSTWLIQGVVKATLDEVEFLLESFMSRLDVQIPRTVFQAECNNALYDEWCTVVKATFEVTSTVSAATISTVTHGTLTPAVPPFLHTYEDGYFDWGEIEFTSGNLLGLKQTIARYVAATKVLSMFAPFPEVPNVDSSIKLWPGCHKTVADCRDKFNNLLNFRGFPYMPAFEETVG